MRPFQYQAPTARDAAVTLCTSKPSAQFLGGGITLIDLMKLDVMRPELLVDIGRLPMTTVEDRGDALFVGALVKNSDLAAHALVLERYPALSQALLSGASPQLRNMATVGGNLLQRTRCLYFRDLGTRCNKREPGTGCDAQDGYNRQHAVLGVSDACIAANPSDMCVAMVAFDAKVHTFGPKGERTIELVDFHLLPENRPERETVLEPGELIVGVSLPRASSFSSSVYLKVRDRASFAFALTSAAVGLKVEGGTIRAARVAMGGVGTKPWRAREAENSLVGKAAGPRAFEDAAEVALRDARPRKHNAFKVALGKKTLVRALTVASGVA